MTARRQSASEVAERDAELCNGSTTDSGSVCLGSSPGSATKRDCLMKIAVSFF